MNGGLSRMTRCRIGDVTVWLPIPGYERTYEVSDMGEVRSRPRPRTRGGTLKTWIGRRGYPVVSLVQNGRQATRVVHGLVALTFLGPRPESQEVRHLNGDPTDARASNLAYGTRGENVRDKRHHGSDHNVNKTHCPQGHPYDESNTYVLPSRPGARYCRECARVRALARYHAKRTPDFDEAWRPDAG